MPNWPIPISIDAPFHTEQGDWEAKLAEEPREFAQRTCLHYKYKFHRDGTERTITLLVPKVELTEEHREDEIRALIHDRLVYSAEEEVVVNPYGCPPEWIAEAGPNDR